MRNESDRDRVIRQGRQALKMLNTDQNFTWWLDVGDAILIGREECMREAGTNKPEGGRYNRLFGAWLAREKLDFDKGDRKRLLDVMDNRLAIEEWRAEMPLVKRRKINHPSTVLRKWKADKIGKPGGKRTNSNAANAILRRDLAAAKAHIVDLESARGVKPQRAKIPDQTLDELRPQIVASLGKMNHAKRHTALSDLATHLMKEFPDIDIQVLGNIGSIEIGGTTKAKPAPIKAKTKKAKADGKPAPLTDEDLKLGMEAMKEGLGAAFSGIGVKVRKTKAKAKVPATTHKANEALPWKETRSSAVGYQGCEATANNRRYRIDVTISNGLTFRGYSIFEGARPQRVLRNNVKTIDEAKAIAQADYDSYRQAFHLG